MVFTYPKEKYALEILRCQDFGMQSSLRSHGRLQNTTTKGAPYSDVASYRRLIGQLLYLVTSGLDIAFSIQ